MNGRLFTLFEGSSIALPAPSYFILLLAGFVMATLMGALWAKRLGQDPDVIVNLGLAMLLAGVAGARILHVLADGYLMDYVHLCTDPSQVGWPVTEAECATRALSPAWDAAAGVCRPTERDCFAWAKFWNGGLAYYGGFLGAGSVGFYLMKVDRFPAWRAADMAGLMLPLGLGFGRMGCLLAGCCFGVPTQSALGLVFPPNSPASTQQWKAELLTNKGLFSLPVHPTQIYESAGAFLVAFLLVFWAHGRKRYDGQIFLASIALYAVLRFVIEFWRNDDRGALLGLSTSQLIGVGLIGFAAWVHRRRSASAAQRLARVGQKP